MARGVIETLDEATKKAYGVITPAESATLFIQNLNKVRTEKPEKALFLYPGGSTEEW